ncbi:NADP-dependent oxidoreductase [Catenulispora yoronensis]|uniref:NADP-dependent oxidoreductase n=1 Tax=Catenulispora yoronensis TaxID=450799 RepID=A0ABN2V6M2_9ACTN
MKSARIHEYGDASVIRYEDAPRPVPGPDEVLIQVAATSFNPTESFLRAGMLHNLFPLTFPYILGWDVAGTVVEVGADTEGLAVGDQVVGRSDQGGACAEYVAVPAAVLVTAPKSIPLAHAAALPVAGHTAWQAVFEHAELRAGERVLVNGAGGGVGGFVTQLAKHAGATVIATAGPRSTAAVRAQGADQIVDYTASPIAEQLTEPVDVLINVVAIPPSETAALAALVRPGGRIVSVATPFPADGDSGVTTLHMVARNDPAGLAALVALVDAGVVRVDVSAEYTFADTAEVHRLSEAGRIRGKVVLNAPDGQTA